MHLPIGFFSGRSCQATYVLKLRSRNFKMVLFHYGVRGVMLQTLWGLFDSIWYVPLTDFLIDWSISNFVGAEVIL